MRTIIALVGRLRPAAIAALAIGVSLVALYDLTLSPTRYAYSADSASYIEMASSLRATGRLRVTPWDLVSDGPDEIPQKLFPPGFAIMIAALVPLAGDARSAALIPGRVAAALLPLLIVVCWRGSASPATLLVVGVWTLLTPGVRDWQYIAYSDVPALALAVVALGALAHLLAAENGSSCTRPAAWYVAGIAAGLCYTVRNAGLAVLASAAAALCYAWLRGYLHRGALARWTLGASLPLGALAAYNLATFGRLQPYAMPASERSVGLNVLDYGLAQLEDVGLPRLGSGWQAGALALIALLVLIVLLGCSWWTSRRDRAAHVRLTVLGLYVVGGGLLLIASRSRYEWGNQIDTRNTLQYTFALLLALALSAERVRGAGARRMLAALGGAGLGAMLLSTAAEGVALYRAPAEFWLALSRNSAVIAAARELPPATLIASNYSVLFRIEATRAVRQLDVSGTDQDFAGSLAELTRAAGSRPSTFLLVCDPEWTGRFSACQPGAAPSGPVCMRIAQRPTIVARCDPPQRAAGSIVPH